MIITKISKDLEAEKNMVGQAKNIIIKLDRRIIEAQNTFIHLFDVFYTISATAARSATAAV